MYYGTNSGAYNQARGAGLLAGNVNNYTVTGLNRGQIYYFSVTAYDAAGNESTYSSEASKLIQ